MWIWFSLTRRLYAQVETVDASRQQFAKSLAQQLRHFIRHGRRLFERRISGDD